MNKKILLITRNFPPLVGGMERFVWNVYLQLQKTYSCDVVGPNDANRYIEEPEKEHSEYKADPIPLYLSKAALKSFGLAFRNDYSLCIAGSGVTAPLATMIGKIFSIPVITFVYGLDLVVENKPYQSLFVPSIKHSHTVIAISQSTKELALEKGVPEEKIQILYPGVDSKQEPDLTFKFREKYQLQDKKILLSVGRLIPRKGLPEFIQYSLSKVVASCPDTILIIIGSEAKNALKVDQNVEAKIRQAINSNNLQDHVILAGRVEDDELWAAYNESDLFIFPLREEKGDIEGFGMVAIEAAAHGLPTAAFSVGGVVDAVAEGSSGFLVPAGDYSQMSYRIIEYIKNGNETITPENCKEHAETFSWDNFGNGLRQICAAVENMKN